MTTQYFRPLARTDNARSPCALTLAGGWVWFDTVECLSRDAPPRLMAAADLPGDIRDRLTAPRAAVAGLRMDRPRLMGILNVTPDSFSDGGLFDMPDAALAHARAMAEAVDILDIGGESTRPGAVDVPAQQEISRTAPVIRALRAGGLTLPISIDTRKAPVARAALEAGASMVNDVSALDYDPDLGALVAGAGVPLCVMHAQGTPQTMQADPRYENVLLDVYDDLAARVEQAEAAGIPRGRIIVDPGIGFGKTVAHNLALIRGLSLFHGLGCPVLLGASRKGFIGVIGNAREAADRAPGSIAVALHGAAQGIQITRIHDAAQTRQAFQVIEAIRGGDG